MTGRVLIALTAAALVLTAGASSYSSRAAISLQTNKPDAAYQFGDVSTGIRAYTVTATASWFPETTSYDGYFDMQDLTDQVQLPPNRFGKGNTGGISSAKVTIPLFSAFSGHLYRITAHWIVHTPGGASAEEDSPVLILRVPKNEPVPRFTDQQKRNFGTAALFGYTHCLGAILMLGMVTVGPAALVLIGVAAAFAGAGVGFTALNLDPVDPNYRVVAKPRFPSPPKVTAGDGVSERAAAAVRKLLGIQMREIGLQRALLTSLNRSQGAHVKKQASWEKKQMQAAGRYASQLAAAVLADVKLRPTVVAALADTEIASLRPTDEIAFSTEGSFIEKDLPASFRTALSKLGLTKAEQTEVHGQLVAADPSFWPRGAAATIAGPKALAALRNAARSLQAFAKKAAKTPLATRPP